jgi:hypothetical protein
MAVVARNFGFEKFIASGTKALEGTGLVTLQ